MQLIDVTLFQPYILKTYFSAETPPVNITKAAIGNGAIGTIDESTEMPVVCTIEIYVGSSSDTKIRYL